MFVCTFTYEKTNEPIGPFLSCFMCVYIRRKMRSGPVQNGLDQSRIWTACPDMPSRFFDLDRGVPQSGPNLDQIWTKSGPNLESSKNRLSQFRQPPNLYNNKRRKKILKSEKKDHPWSPGTWEYVESVPRNPVFMQNTWKKSYPIWIIRSQTMYL